MDIEKKVGSEITVRISLTFQDAPDVHTLLTMTPVRQRGKLIRLALERYIRETGHVSGSVDVQIEAISSWLRSRNLSPNDQTIFQEKTQVTKSRNLIAVKNTNSTSSAEVSSNHNSHKAGTSISNHEIVESQSINRWLDF